MRKTLNPTDVFNIMQDRMKRDDILIDEFKVIREEAQRTTGIQNCNLYEIYDRLQEMTGISDDDRDKILSLELEVEKSVLVTRKDMVEIFHHAVEAGKRVFLVSDMYIPGDLLEKILESLGIIGYEKL